MWLLWCWHCSSNIFCILWLFRLRKKQILTYRPADNKSTTMKYYFVCIFVLGISCFVRTLTQKMNICYDRCKISAIPKRQTKYMMRKTIKYGHKSRMPPDISFESHQFLFFCLFLIVFDCSSHLPSVEPVFDGAGSCRRVNAENTPAKNE